MNSRFLQPIRPDKPVPTPKHNAESIEELQFRVARLEAAVKILIAGAKDASSRAEKTIGEIPELKSILA